MSEYEDCISWMIKENYPDTYEANARLIAAAPDLLAALERCLNQLDAFAGCTTPEQTGFEDVRKTASYIASRAALAKAKGEA